MVVLGGGAAADRGAPGQTSTSDRYQQGCPRSAPRGRRRSTSSGREQPSKLEGAGETAKAETAFAKAETTFAKAEATFAEADA
eukprot:5725020-Alexandrium_andersonii.AAC.1